MIIYERVVTQSISINSMKKNIKLFAVSACMLVVSLYADAAVKKHTVSSPNGKLTATVESGENLSWSLNYNGQPLVAPSEISMTLADGTVYGAASKVSRESRKAVDRMISTALYKKAQVKDAYNEMTLKFKTF